MGGYFTIGEIKTRPGVYKRYENVGIQTAGAEEKVAACVVTGNWGPLNIPVTVENGTDISTIIGSGTGADVLTEIFAYGPAECVVVRAGSGGTKATLDLEDTATTAAAVITLSAKYPGNRAFSVTVKPSLDDANVKQAFLYEGTKLLETRSFYAETGVSEVEAFVAAFADSKYLDVTKKAEGNGNVATVTQEAFTAGTNPTVNAEAYSAALDAIESEVWHYICCDSNETTIHALLAAFVDRIHDDGAYGRAVIGEPHTVSLETRMQHAKAYNDEKVIYVLNSWEGTNGVTYEGYLAAARLCGMAAAKPSSESLTHDVVKGAAKLSEGLTNSQIKKAIKAGCIVFSLSKNRQVIIEKGINTLVTPSGNQDEGWKKIKRTDVRFELMDRIEKTVEPMIGDIDNDTNGRAAVMAAAQRVIDAMVGEGKLISGTCSLDTSNKSEGDSAWFVISVDDTDSIETIYLTFRFRFSQYA